MDEQQPKDAPQVVQPQWQYQSGQLEQPQVPNEPDISGTAISEDSIRWTASEFVSHEKTSGWYVALAFVAVLASAIIFLLTKSVYSVVVVLVLALALAVFGALKPRTLDYALDADGVTVGDKHFLYESFRSFTVIDEGPVPSIQLLPLKRFMVPITIYFAPEDADIIIDTLGQFLPFDHKKRDFIDKLSSRIRF